MLIRERDREILLRIFETVDTPVEIWAYGSRVSGNAHSGSDLDLVIRHQNLDKIPPAMLSQLRNEIRESNVTFMVDLHDWNSLPPSYQENILQNYEVFFQNIHSQVNEPNPDYPNKPDK